MYSSTRHALAYSEYIYSWINLLSNYSITASVNYFDLWIFHNSTNIINKQNQNIKFEQNQEYVIKLGLQ